MYGVSAGGIFGRTKLSRSSTADPIDDSGDGRSLRPFCAAPAIPSVTVPRSRIMYIENKAPGLTGPARIGRVTFSKRGSTIYYQGRAFQSLKGAGFKANYYDVETGEEYWISGPKKNGEDRLYGEAVPVEID